MLSARYFALLAGVGFFLAILGKTLSDAEVLGPKETVRKAVYDATYWPDVPNVPKNRTQIGTEKGCIYMLVRNMELHEALESIRKIEDRFNRRYRYPWIFLNDDEFTDEFKLLTAGMVSGDAKYGFIEPEVWNVPDHINKTKMDECIEQMIQDDVIYGFGRPYRNMCRFNSGNFFWHPLMLPYDYYWRVEPGIDFYCDQRYDPFTFMRLNDKVYGFVITFTEFSNTIPSLFRTLLGFLKENPQHLAPNNGLDFVQDHEPTFPWLSQDDMDRDNIDGYNLCHFWSNFEIGSLKFFRSEAYTSYFQYLDKSGGFYYERWGDAPVHTLGVLSLANKSQIHHFSDMGYYHPPYYRCPFDDASYSSGRCLCPEVDDSIDFKDWSCLPKWWKHAGKEVLFNMDPNAALYD